MFADSVFSSCNWRHGASLGILSGAWLYANRSALFLLLQSLQQASILNLLLVGVTFTALLVQLIRQSKGTEKKEQGLVTLQPLLLMLATVAMAIALQWLVDIPQISIFLFTLGSYGLWGVFVNPKQWRRGLPSALLAACVLPVCTLFGSGLGFPVRVLTAHVVEQILSTWQISAISSQDIILLENGIAHIDLPCSGVKSLWTGGFFLLMATWLERRRLGWHWWGVCAVTGGLLVLGNMMRVLLLVLMGQVLNQPQFAQILHLPLGLLGFIIACATGWILLQRVPRYREKTEEEALTIDAQPVSMQSTYLGIAIALILLAQVKPALETVQPLTSIHLPLNVATETLPLTEAEQRFFDDAAKPVVQKQRFTFNTLSGSMLLVTSRGWHPHHPPELCLVGNGLKVDSMISTTLSPEINARWLSLQDGQLAATYWFQSPQRTTDDFIKRIWEYVAHRNRTWVLVSVLFDNFPELNSTEIQTFASTVHDAIDQSLNQG